MLNASERKPDPIKDCPAGLVCYTFAEDAQRNSAIIEALATMKRMGLEIERLKAEQPGPLGWAAVCGMTMTPSFGDPGSGRTYTIGCTWGWGIKHLRWPGR